jgi:ApaG protein
MYTQTTHSITVTVYPEYQEDISSPVNGSYVWAYLIIIENRGQETIQLLNRHWKIIDATGHIEEVIGKGVVGQQPVIHPDEAFEYSSQTHLSTSSGIMMGTYQMELLDSRTMVEIAIPAFSLDMPHGKVVVN